MALNPFGVFTLRPEDFTPEASGRLVRAIPGYWTFEPNPLPPRLSYDEELVHHLGAADWALGELAGVGRFLPNPHLLIRPFVRREAVLSSRIEGTVTRLDELLSYEASPPAGEPDGDLLEVANYVAAVELGLAQLAAGVPLCLRLLREVHARLMEGVRGTDKLPGRFRPRDVMIGRAGQGYDDARFVPPSHLAIEPMLRALEGFLNAPGTVPVVVQLALAHYQFEAIHPFLDGNGRLGRLLLTLLLCERKVLPQPLLYLSAYLERHDAEYRDHLLAVSRQGAWREWVVFVARGVAEQAADAVLRSKRLLDLWREYRDRVQRPGRPAKLLGLVDQVFAAPAVTATGVGKALGVSFPTATRYVAALVEDGILADAGGRARGKVFIARGVMALLGEGNLSPGG